MSRLTRFHEEGLLVNNGGYYEPDKSNYMDITNKLGKLEDLEDQLGCPLDVVVKALKEGIYKKCTYDIGMTYIEPQYLSFDGKCLDCSIGDFLDYVNVADYGKTWWLKGDKEE